MKKVVIIDDELDSLQIMQDVFEEYTCRVFTAKTGKEGLRLIQSARPDLLLLDLRLPDISGEEVLQQVKAQHPHLKIIIGTAYGDQKTRDELLKKGADGFFDKPIDLNAFERKARELLGTLSEIRLLVIDDEPEFCRSFKDILENDGETKWTVHVAETGQEGLKLAEEIMPDLISLDICLSVKGDTSPFANGLEVYRELKRRGFQIPIVILASYIDTPDAEALHEEGLATIFSKTDLMGVEHMSHFLNVLKRIALRGSNSQKTRGGDE